MRRSERAEWLETVGKPLRLYARLMGANIPDYYWDNWFNPYHLALAHKRSEALHGLVELAILGHRGFLTPEPATWHSAITINRYLETLRAEKYSQP